jgi:hypothetical protein
MKLNKYMAQKLSGLDEEDNCEDVLSDVQNASDFGVSSDRDHALYFFVQNGLDELVQDWFNKKLTDEELSDLKRYVFDFKDNKDYDLTKLEDIGIIVFKWFDGRKLNKAAHPNISGIHVRPGNIDEGKWIETAKTIYNQVNDGIPRNVAFKTYTSGWDRDEVIKFSAWLRYYEQHTPEKYNVKTANNSNLIKVAFGESITFPAEWENLANRTQMQPFRTDPIKTKKELEIERATDFKAKMKSRMRALKMLLDKYNDLLPHQNLDHIYEEILSLEKSVSRLNAYAALEDRIIRSATIMEKYGFDAGALILKEAGGGADETNLPPGLMKTNVEAVITKLEGISKELKMRNLVREMSKADIALAELGLGSYFPELGESIARMLEGFSYAGNRIEDSISKLRGSGKSIQAPEPTSPAPKLPKTPEAPAAPLPIPTAPQPTEKLEPSALHEQPTSKVKTELPTQVKSGT